MELRLCPREIRQLKSESPTLQPLFPEVFGVKTKDRVEGTVENAKCTPVRLTGVFVIFIHLITIIPLGWLTFNGQLI